MKLYRTPLIFLLAGILPPAIFAAEAPSAKESPSHLHHLVLVVPEVAGSGLDDMGKALQQSLVQGKFIDSVTIENFPGSHGQVGIRTFLQRHHGDPNALLVAGRTLIEAKDVAAEVSRLVPIARLSGEFEVIAIPAVGQDIQSFDNLVRGLREKPGRLPHVPLNELVTQGVSPSLANWRAVFAAPGISPEQRNALEIVITSLAESEEWREQMSFNHWSGSFLPADVFASELAERRTAIQDNATTPGPKQTGRIWKLEVWILENRWSLIVVSLVVSALSYLRFRNRWTDLTRRESSLHQELRVERENVTRIYAEKERLLQGVSEQIEAQFGQWSFTEAEREVAMLMLKGLRHKEIADIRGTTERTVRQQAVVIYKKAGISGRTDLAAYFLEDLLQPWSPSGRS